MGSWVEVCAVSGAAIQYDEEVVFFLIVKEISEKWHLYRTPIFGKYDSYGNVTLSDEEVKRVSALMPEKITDLRDFLEKVARDDVPNPKDYGFIFASKINTLFIKTKVYDEMMNYFGNLKAKDYIWRDFNGKYSTLKEFFDYTYQEYLSYPKEYTLMLNIPKDEIADYSEAEQDVRIFHWNFDLKRGSFHAEALSQAETALATFMFEQMKKPIITNPYKGSQSDNYTHLRRLARVVKEKKILTDPYKEED